VSAGNDDRAYRGSRNAAELGGHALHRSARLRVRVEEIAGDEEQIDGLGNGEVDRGFEGRELALAQNRRSFSQIGVPCPKVDIGGVKQAKHRASGSSSGHGTATAGGAIVAGSGMGDESCPSFGGSKSAAASSGAASSEPERAP
jgi:hypothetical protein